MIKKITFAIIFCVMIIYCGKKGDPEYKGPEKTSKILNIIINKV